MLLLAGRLHNMHRTESLGESWKYIVKTMGFFVVMFTSIMKLPFLVLIFQGFLCGESPE
jgi:hypothetical protein